MIDKRIKILLIIFSFDIEAVGGGISRFAVSLAEALDPAKYQVALCGLWSRGSEVELKRINELNNAGIQAFTCALWDEAHPYRAFLAAYRHLRRVVGKEQYDIVHSHSLFGDIAALLLVFEGKARRILRTLHNELRTEWSRRPVRRLLLTNLLYPLAFEAEIGVSEYICNGLNGRWLARRLGRQAVTLHNALDIQRFRNASCDKQANREELGIPAGAYLIGSIGRLTRQKGYDVLLRAVKLALVSIPDLYMLLIGDGEDREMLQKQAAELGLERNVKFTGARTDVDALLSALDQFVCSSRWEGLSTAVMEAMAVGIPIVATNIPGNRELLRPGQSAWFVPAEDDEALAHAIRVAYQNPDLAKEFARQARLGVEGFGIEEVARRHDMLYQIVVEQRSKSSWWNHHERDVKVNEAISKP